MKKIILTLIVLLIATSIYAGDVSRKGTTGADYLLIPVSARGIATGGAFVANLTGLESIYYNPAGLDVSSGTEFMFSYMSYLADVKISYLGASTNFGDFGSLGFTLKSLAFGDIPITTVDFPDGTGSTYSPTYLTLGLTYSKVITDRISVGTNIKVLSESIENVSANGWAIDLGVQYKFTPDLMIGAAVMNIGPNMQYSGPELSAFTGIPGSNPGTPGGQYEVITESFQIPSYFLLSLAYNLNFNEQNNLLLASTFTANNSLEDVMNFGLEYGFLENFFVRGGYNLLLENTDQNIFGLTFGAGVDYQMGSDIGFAFDYAFRDVKDFPTENHVFTIKLRFQ
jgi:opacity protein-like surface antigen